MNTNKSEMRKVPGFTAEQTLDQGASTPYAGLAGRGAEGGRVEPAYTAPVSHCHYTCVRYDGQLYCGYVCPNLM